MALINLDNLGLYHQKLKDWISKNKYIHPVNHPATIIIQDKYNKFVTEEQLKKINANKILNFVSFEYELSENESEISVDYSISDNTRLWLFIDGIKQIKNKHFTISSNNIIKLTNTYEDKTNIEIIIFVEEVPNDSAK